MIFTQHQDDGLLGEDDQALIGFAWRGGAERETTGVLLWSKPYICTLPNGEEVSGIPTSSFQVRCNLHPFPLIF